MVLLEILPRTDLDPGLGLGVLSPRSVLHPIAQDSFLDTWRQEKSLLVSRMRQCCAKQNPIQPLGFPPLGIESNVSFGRLSLMLSIQTENTSLCTFCLLSCFCFWFYCFPLRGMFREQLFVLARKFGSQVREQIYVAVRRHHLLLCAINFLSGGRGNTAVPGLQSQFSQYLKGSIWLAQTWSQEWEGADLNLVAVSLPGGRGLPSSPGDGLRLAGTPHADFLSVRCLQGACREWSPNFIRAAIF